MKFPLKGIIFRRAQILTNNPLKQLIIHFYEFFFLMKINYIIRKKINFTFKANFSPVLRLKHSKTFPFIPRPRTLSVIL